MKLVVGLGNPGPKYASTRHNIGFRVATQVAARLAVPLSENRFEGRYGRAHVDALEEDVAVLLPQTFMNRSGEAVAEATDALLAEGTGFDIARDLVVVYDDLDLPLARLRLRPKGGPGGHNGMSDILMCLETDAVPRLRFGIGRPAVGAGAGTGVIDYVLEAFGEAEERELVSATPRAAEAIELALRVGVESAMTEVNRSAASLEE